MKANYTYLSDGTKAAAYTSANAGKDYAGSFTYTRGSGGSKTLESVAFGGGRIRRTGTNTYDVDYYITDHLGSLRAIVNAGGSVVEQNDYYPFGTRHSISGQPTLSGNRWRFAGKEEQDLFGIAYSDFVARLYGRTAWTAIDPLAEKYYSVSPYAYCVGNPANIMDPDGNALRISRLRHKTISNLAMIAATQRGSAILSELSENTSYGKFVPTYNIIPVLFEKDASFDGKDIKYVIFPRLPAGYGSPSERSYFAHELSHAYDVISGSLPIPRRQDYSQKAITESNSVTLENYIRSVYDIPFLRKYYNGYDSSPYFHPNTKRMKGERVTHFKEINRSKDGKSYGYSYISNVNGIESKNYIVAGVDRDNLFYFNQYESEEAFREATKDW